MSRRCYFFPANQDNKGFTLIELVITIGIVAIIMIPIFTLFLNSIKTNAMGEDKMQATMAAQKYMEEIKSYSNIEEIIEGQREYNGFIIELEVDKELEWINQIKDESMNHDNVYDVLVTNDKNILKIYHKDELIDSLPINTIESIYFKLSGGNLFIYLNKDHGKFNYKISFVNNPCKIKMDLKEYKGIQIFYKNSGNHRVEFIYDQENNEEEEPEQQDTLNLYEINIRVKKNNKVLERLTGYIRSIDGDIQIP